MEIKKSKRANLESKRRVFFLIGLIMVSSTILLAFEWKDYDRIDDTGLLVLVDDFEEEIDNTFRNEPVPPPPPPPPKDIIVIVENDKKIEEEFEVEDIETEEEEVVENEIEEIEEVIDEPEFFMIVEEMPSFKGGQKALRKYIRNNLVYPHVAREAEIQGKVYVQFIIDELGKPTKVKVVRGFNKLCDAEAVRVVRNMPEWTPGKQRGIPVKVQYTMELTFVLE